MAEVSGNITQLGVAGSIAQLGIIGSITQLGVAGSISEGATSWSIYTEGDVGSHVLQTEDEITIIKEEA